MFPQDTSDNLMRQSCASSVVKGSTRNLRVAEFRATTGPQINFTGAINRFRLHSVALAANREIARVLPDVYFVVADVIRLQP